MEPAVTADLLQETLYKLGRASERLESYNSDQTSVTQYLRLAKVLVSWGAELSRVVNLGHLLDEERSRIQAGLEDEVMRASLTDYHIQACFSEYWQGKRKEAGMDDVALHRVLGLLKGAETCLVGGYTLATRKKLRPYLAHLQKHIRSAWLRKKKLATLIDFYSELDPVACVQSEIKTYLARQIKPVDFLRGIAATMRIPGANQ